MIRSSESELLLAAWQDKAFELFVAEGKIDQQTVDQMRSWPHSGFSVDNSVYLPPRDTAGLRRLSEYILRCPFSLARVVRLTDDGSVIYRAQQDHCRRFPGPASADLRGGPKRNFQIFSALDFLAEVTQHIPDKGEHLVRYYGWYSHRQRGMRAKAGCCSADESPEEQPERTVSGSKTCSPPSGEPENENPPIDRSALSAQKSAADGPRPCQRRGRGRQAGSISTWATCLPTGRSVCRQAGLSADRQVCLPTGRCSSSGSMRWTRWSAHVAAGV